MNKTDSTKTLELVPLSQRPHVTLPFFKMATTGKMLVVIALVMLPVIASGDKCLAPTVATESYTTPEITVSTETIFISQFSLTCKNGLKNINLYAEVAGRVVPATRTKDGNKYQISVSDEHKNLPSGSYEIRIFDEEGYSLLRKAQRSGESAENVKPLVTTAINHQGVWKGTLIQTEMVAALVAVLVWWLAYTAKSSLQA
ncbi:translocon-associated protein subunit delta-like [Haliotis cracherodii]|uniref:translocon-associated protein subunit delta-like n=1 Tax=Haliotis cracherodii TaxID=6455 RepID=UPI0039ECCEDC